MDIDCSSPELMFMFCPKFPNITYIFTIDIVIIRDLHVVELEHVNGAREWSISWEFMRHDEQIDEACRDRDRGYII